MAISYIKDRIKQENWHTANGLYIWAKEGFLNGTVNFSTDNIKALLVDAGAYTVNLTTHANLSDIDSLARFGTSSNLSSKTVAGGVADAADVTFSAVRANR